MTSQLESAAHTTGRLYRPVFPETWKETSLHSLATWINGMAFRDFHFSPSGKPVIKIAEIKNGITHQTKFTDNSYKEDYFISDGDLLFCWSGQPETSIDTFIWRGRDGWLNQHIFKVLADTTQCTQSFLFYLLKYLKRNFVAIARNKQTTGLGHVTKDDLERLKVRVPDKGYQQTIVSRVIPFDDKIELLRRQNETLEAIAQTIFKEWFVNFNFPNENDKPYRDSGGKMIDSELGKIPEGWKAKELGDVLTLEYGKALRTDKRQKGAIPVIGSNGQVGWHNQHLVSGPGVVIGRKGNPGTVRWIHKDFFPIDTTFFIRPKPEIPSLYFAYFALKRLNLPSLEADSAVPGLNRNLAYMCPQVMPDKNVVTIFDKIAKSLFTKISQNDSHYYTLVHLRDTLLPKLMSGQVRVQGDATA